MTKADWKKQAMKVGQHIASTWGAVCEDVEIDKKTGDIIVLCNECGDKFTTTISVRDWGKYAKECGVA